MFNYEEANLSLIFSGADVSQFTTMLFVISDIFDILKGIFFKYVMAHETEVNAYLKKIIVLWAGYGATNIGWQKSKIHAFKLKRS